MKDLLKKYWWLILIITVLPVIVNYVLLIPAFGPVVGDSVHWLAFWGSYLTSLVSALIAFLILFIQRRDNHIENKQNRQLQINVLKYQQEMQWLNEKREIIQQSVLSLHKNDLRLLSKRLSENLDIYEEAKQLMDKVLKSKYKILFMDVPVQTKEYNMFINKIYKACRFYQVAILDILEISMIFSKPETERKDVYNDREAKGYIQGNLKQIIEQINSVESFLSKDPVDISKELIQKMPNLLPEVRILALEYINSEEKRIAQLLTTTTSVF